MATRKRWGGLSDDPEKRARQLAGLAQSNPHVAAKLAAGGATSGHENVGAEVAPAALATAEPAAPAGGELPVHDYVEEPDAGRPDPAPARPVGEPEPAAREPEPEPVAQPEPAPERRSGLGEFFGGLARGY